MTVSDVATFGSRSARLLSACILFLLLIGCGRNSPDADAPSSDRVAQDVLYYYDPMRPEVHFDQPGQSPFMDMALVPKYADTRAGMAAGVAVSAQVVQTLGIRTAKPARREVRPRARVPARVVADARSQARLQSRVDGWIEQLAVRAVGEPVTAGSVIAQIYSPALVQAQEELLLGADTAGPAAERLRRFGMADSDINAIRRGGKTWRRVPLRAPVSGVITDLGVREGSRVSPDSLIADIAASHAVWIEAQLFPGQRLQLGKTMSARFTLPGVPDHEWRAEHGSLVPLVDAVTQTQAVRFPVGDAEDLPLGTVLDAEIDGTPRSNVLLVPTAAVIRTAAGDRVLVAHGKNRFMPMPVALGEQFGDDTEVRSGLKETDDVVVSGQFLLDAEANLQAGMNRLGEAAPSSASAPAHADHAP